MMIAIEADGIERNFDPRYPLLLYTDTAHGRYWYPRTKLEGEVIFECDATEYRCGKVWFVRPSQIPARPPSTDPDFHFGEVYIPDVPGGTRFYGGSPAFRDFFATKSLYQAIKWVIEQHEKWLDRQFEKALEMPDSGDKTSQSN